MEEVLHAEQLPSAALPTARNLHARQELLLEPHVIIEQSAKETRQRGKHRAEANVGLMESAHLQGDQGPSAGRSNEDRSCGAERRRV